MPAMAIAMNSAELVKAISRPAMWPSVKYLTISNWWIGSSMPGSIPACPALPALAARHFPSPPSSGPGLTTPAERMTLSTPAANPSSRKTIMPHGDVPSQRSISQPRMKPIATPPTSSADNRMPRANPDMSAVDRDAEPESADWPGPTWSSRSPRRRSRAARAASSGGRESLSFPRVPLLMTRHPQPLPARRQGARTILTAQRSVKNPTFMYKPLKPRANGPRRTASAEPRLLLRHFAPPCSLLASVGYARFLATIVPQMHAWLERHPGGDHAAHPIPRRGPVGRAGGAGPDRSARSRKRPLHLQPGSGRVPASRYAHRPGVDLQQAHGELDLPGGARRAGRARGRDRAAAGRECLAQEGDDRPRRAAARRHALGLLRQPAPDRLEAAQRSRP